MKDSLESKSIAQFNRDAGAAGAYQYVTSERLSTRLAIERRNQALHEAAAALLTSPPTAAVLDIGCGDGTFTRLAFDTLRPMRMVGIDPAEAAIHAANASHTISGRLQFGAGSAYALPYSRAEFDLAVFRESLHHMDRPAEAIAEAARVAKHVLILEPNGYNPVLKIIEKTSRYHIEHGERSYSPRALVRWCRNAGLVIRCTRYAGIVPVFAPAAFARFLSFTEPMFERLPIGRRFYCASVVISAGSRRL